jgi:eukaryotic-like serine/threonine-protein kinase
MAGTIHLEVIGGAMKGRQFAFTEHDTFLFGRMPDCHACLPADNQVSRHHFILEVNPPDACLRDLGSLNGTYVNSLKYGGRASNETPEEGARYRHHEVALKDGDEIVVGQTVLRMRLEMPAICCECSAPIPAADRPKCSWLAGEFICQVCKSQIEHQVRTSKVHNARRCKNCGRDISEEICPGRRGDFLCRECQNLAAANPIQLLEHMLCQADKAPDADGTLKISGYEVEKNLRIGGFGAVYLARRKEDLRQVAIKVMLSKVAVDERSRGAFLREIENMKVLRHKHIVPMLESGSAGTAFYFVMEFCDGGSVGDLIRAHDGGIPLSEASPIMLHALEGLAFAHKRGYVHRDLKPDNVLLVGTGKRRVAKISDFGLSKNFENAGFSGHTVTGSYGGTPTFMPREQVVNFRYMKPVSDIWSIGATFYVMLTGQSPRDFVQGVDPIQIILQERVISIRERDANVPRKVAEVIDRALSNDVKERYQDALEMKIALSNAL